MKRVVTISGARLFTSFARISLLVFLFADDDSNSNINEDLETSNDFGYICIGDEDDEAVEKAKAASLALDNWQNYLKPDSADTRPIKLALRLTNGERHELELNDACQLKASKSLLTFFDRMRQFAGDFRVSSQQRRRDKRMPSHSSLSKARIHVCTCTFNAPRSLFRASRSHSC